jgi:hypothetical protein
MSMRCSRTLVGLFFFFALAEVSATSEADVTGEATLSTLIDSTTGSSSLDSWSRTCDSLYKNVFNVQLTSSFSLALGRSVFTCTCCCADRCELADEAECRVLELFALCSLPDEV